ncbi:MAG: hypothetical protein NVS1B6_14680 [Steroidobacteraceae bacterium]
MQVNGSLLRTFDALYFRFSVPTDIVCNDSRLTITPGYISHFKWLWETLLVWIVALSETTLGFRRGLKTILKRRDTAR